MSGFGESPDTRFPRHPERMSFIHQHPMASRNHRNLQLHGSFDGLGFIPIMAMLSGLAL